MIRHSSTLRPRSDTAKRPWLLLWLLLWLLPYLFLSMAGAGLHNHAPDAAHTNVWQAAQQNTPAAPAAAASVSPAGAVGASHPDDSAPRQSLHPDCLSCAWAAQSVGSLSAASQSTPPLSSLCLTPHSHSAPSRLALTSRHNRGPPLS